MQISWVLLAENVVVNEHSRRMDIIGEFRNIVADQFPYTLPKFYIVGRVETDVHEPVALPYKLTLRRPSDELVELHSSEVSVNIPPNAGHIIGNLIAEIQNFHFMEQGRHEIAAELGDSVFNTDIVVFPRRNITHDTQK